MSTKQISKPTSFKLEIDDKNLTFSKAIGFIEKICQKLQDDSIELEEIAEYYSKAIYLQQFCQERLDKIQNEIEQVQADRINKSND